LERENPFLNSTTTQLDRGKPVGSIWGYRDNGDGMRDGGVL